MRRLSDFLARLVARLLVAALAALVALATAETVAWTVFAVSWAAAPEVEGLLLVWLGVLSAAYGVHERLHLGVEVVTRRLPSRWQRRLARASSALVALFGALLAVYGGRLAMTVTNTLPATGWSAAAQYLPAAVGGVLIAYFAVVEALAGSPAGTEQTADAAAAR